MSNEQEINRTASHGLQLIIDGKEYHWHAQYITGNEIKKLGNILQDNELFLKIREPWRDELITDESSVDLARPGIEHFFSKEKPVQVTIIVNGREKPWKEKEISFEQVVTLAFGTYVENSNTVFTVTYKNGPEKNPQGGMVKGEEVYVKNKMIFNVTATDKS